jgi:hypothetical protein
MFIALDAPIPVVETLRGLPLHYKKHRVRLGEEPESGRKSEKKSMPIFAPSGKLEDKI